MYREMQRYKILSFIIFSATLLTCLLLAMPHDIMCTGVDIFDTGASTTFITKVSKLYQDWWLIPFFFDLVFFATTHDEKRKGISKAALIALPIVFVLSKNTALITTTLDTISTWFNTSAPITA